MIGCMGLKVRTHTHKKAGAALFDLGGMFWRLKL